MADKALIDKAGETVGIGVEMVSDVAGAIKTAIGAAVIAVTEVAKETPAKKAEKKAPAKKSTKKAVAKKAAKAPPAKKTAAKKSPAKKAAAKKAVKKSATKTVRSRR